MKLYMVIADTYLNGFGTEVTCLGVFDSLEKAKKLEAHYIDMIRQFCDKKTAMLKEEIMHMNGYLKYSNIYRLEDYVFTNIMEDEVKGNLFKIKEIDLNNEYPLYLDEEVLKWQDSLSGGIKLGEYIECE